MKKLLYLTAAAVLFCSSKSYAAESEDTDTVKRENPCPGIIVAEADLSKMYSWNEAMSLTVHPCPGGWRLPTREELGCMYENRAAIGGFLKRYYWSNEQFNSPTAYVRNFSGGDETMLGKKQLARVRCVKTAK